MSSAVLGQDDRAVHLETFDKVWTLVRDTHFDPELGGLDWEKVRDELRPRAEKASSKAVLRGILNGMLGRLGQSHFSVLPGGGPAAPESERKLTPPGQQTWDSGLGFAVHLVEGEPRVAALTPGSAVARAGVQVGWRIVRVGETPVPSRCETTCEVNFPLLKASGEEVVVEFRGPGSEVREVGLALEARRSRRYEFEGMPAQTVWIEDHVLDVDIGYIAFKAFFDPVLVISQFERALRSFGDTEGLVIDVRGNTGGMGEMALTMIGYFTGGKQKLVGTMTMRDCELAWYTGPRQFHYDRPVAVLIDRASGSSAEIFAAGMRDAGSARLFGQATAGAVLPSVFDRLPNGDSLLHAIANYVTAEGVELEGPGVAPDVETEPRRGTEMLDDEALFLAIDWIRGNS